MVSWTFCPCLTVFDRGWFVGRGAPEHFVVRRATLMGWLVCVCVCVCRRGEKGGVGDLERG